MKIMKCDACGKTEECKYTTIANDGWKTSYVLNKSYDFCSESCVMPGISLILEKIKEGVIK